MNQHKSGIGDLLFLQTTQFKTSEKQQHWAGSYLCTSFTPFFFEYFIVSVYVFVAKKTKQIICPGHTNFTNINSVRAEVLVRL